MALQFQNELTANIEKFRDATFLPEPYNNFTKTKPTILRSLVSEALFYFHTNRFENISLQQKAALLAYFPKIKNDIDSFLIPPTLLWAEQVKAAAATNLTLMPLSKHLPVFAATTRQETFASKLVGQAVENNLELTNPFTNRVAKCQESYELEEANCLRFTDQNTSFFLLQGITCADSVFFPEENVMIGLNSAANPQQIRRLMLLLLSRFDDFCRYAQGNNQFFGLIASHSRPAHFFYEILPTVMEIYRLSPLPLLPANLVMRRDQDFIDLAGLFSGINTSVMASEEIVELSFAQNQWLVCVGSLRHFRTSYYPLRRADQYVLDDVLASKNDEILAKLQTIEGCYPLVWVGLEGQKRCWLEQVDGYAFILNELAKRFPNLGVVIDGWTLPNTPSEMSLDNVVEDLAVAKKLLKKLNSSIKQVLTIGSTCQVKISVGQKVDFFIANFTTGSMLVSRKLAKPGFCHINNVLAKDSLNLSAQIHPNRHVYLLPENLINDTYGVKPFDKSLAIFGEPEKPTTKSLSFIKKLLPVSSIGPGYLSYSINKKAFYQFIDERLDTVLAASAETQSLRFFIDVPFSISSNLKELIKIAAYGNFLPVQPSHPYIRQLTDLQDYPIDYLRQQLIFGTFFFGCHELWSEPAEYMIWLRNPLQRLKLHVTQYSNGQVRKNQPADVTSILKAGHKPTDNFYTRILSGQDAPFGQCTEAMFDQAVENLTQYFCFIGFNEYPLDSFARLSAIMLCDRRVLPDIVEDKCTIPEAVFDQEQEQLAMSLLEFDMRLYQTALAMVQQKE